MVRLMVRLKVRLKIRLMDRLMDRPMVKLTIVSGSEKLSQQYRRQDSKEQRKSSAFDSTELTCCSRLQPLMVRPMETVKVRKE